MGCKLSFMFYANRFLQPPLNQCQFCKNLDTTIEHILNEYNIFVLQTLTSSRSLAISHPTT